MKVPKEKIQIAGRDIKILYDRKRCRQEMYNGVCFPDSSEIILDENLEIEKKNVVFLHEVLHHINSILDKGETDVDKEEYIKPFSELLYQVIKQII